MNPADSMIIIGAGPVGLTTALAIKQKHPHTEIIIYEKHDAYLRTQDIRLNLNNFATLPDIHRQLIQLAKAGRADIDHKSKHSNIRQTKFGTDNQILDKHELRHMIELKYQVKGKADYLSKYHYASAQTATVGISGGLTGGILCDEQLRYTKNTHTTHVTLRFFVSEAIYLDPRLSYANVKNPLPLTNNIPPKLYHAINTWLNRRGDRNFLPDTPKLNKTILPFPHHLCLHHAFCHVFT